MMINNLTVAEVFKNIFSLPDHLVLTILLVFSMILCVVVYFVVSTVRNVKNNKRIKQEDRQKRKEAREAKMKENVKLYEHLSKVPYYDK